MDEKKNESLSSKDFRALKQPGSIRVFRSKLRTRVCTSGMIFECRLSSSPASKTNTGVTKFMPNRKISERKVG